MLFVFGIVASKRHLFVWAVPRLQGPSRRSPVYFLKHTCFFFFFFFLFFQPYFIKHLPLPDRLEILQLQLILLLRLTSKLRHQVQRQTLQPRSSPTSNWTRNFLSLRSHQSIRTSTTGASFFVGETAIGMLLPLQSFTFRLARNTTTMSSSHLRPTTRNATLLCAPNCIPQTLMLKVLLGFSYRKFSCRNR